ncbi:MAG: MFS transporter [Marinilabiliales bacterium]|nr:MFS transporter [Marinilabiliales bacterium]
MAGFLFTVSAVWTALAADFTVFVVFRLVGGIGIGLASNLSPMYIAEIAPAEIRGKLVSVNQLTIVIGILAAQIVNWLIARPVAGRGHRGRHPGLLERPDRLALDVRRRDRPRPAVLLPDVPRPGEPALAGQERPRRERAAKVLDPGRRAGLRRPRPWTRSGPRWPPARSAGSASATSSSRAWPRSCVVGVVLAVYQQWCGINVIFNYAQEIFTAAGYGVSDVLFNIVVTGTVNLVFTFVAIRLVDRPGRKPLMLAGSAGLAVVFGLIGASYALHSRGVPHPAPRPRRPGPLRPVPRPRDLGPALRDLPQPHPRRGHVGLDLLPVGGLLRPDLHLPPPQQGARAGRDVLASTPGSASWASSSSGPASARPRARPWSRSSGSSSAARRRRDGERDPPSDRSSGGRLRRVSSGASTARSGRPGAGHYRRYFKHAARALGLGFVAGFLYFMLWPAQEQKALALVVQALKDIPLGGSAAVLALTLFYHNARASVLAVAAGAVPFLFLPILDPLLNGGVLGLLASVSKHQRPRRPPARPDPDPASRRLRAHRRPATRRASASTSRPEWDGRPRPPGRRGRARKAGHEANPATLAGRGRSLERRSAEPSRRRRHRGLEPGSSANVVRSFVLVVLPLLARRRVSSRASSRRICAEPEGP